MTRTAIAVRRDRLARLRACAAVRARRPRSGNAIAEIIVYGNDPCPRSTDDQVVVCARKPEAERYRIPEKLRPSGPRQSREAWANRAKALETVGETGTFSCSPVGPGGYTGCLTQVINQAARERQQQPTKARRRNNEPRVCRLELRSRAPQGRRAIDRRRRHARFRAGRPPRPRLPRPSRRASATSASPRRASASLITPCRRCSRSTWSITCCVPGRIEKVVGLDWLQAHGTIPASTASRSPRRSSATYTSLVYLTPIFGGIIADS